jgi:serine protease inhibitor
MGFDNRTADGEPETQAGLLHGEAAVTAIDMRATAMPAPEAPPIAFNADHPFFIVLRHKPTHTRLFMGRVASV